MKSIIRYIVIQGIVWRRAGATSILVEKTEHLGGETNA